MIEDRWAVKIWIRVVALVAIAVFVSEQAAWAGEWDKTLSNLKSTVIGGIKSTAGGVVGKLAGPEAGNTVATGRWMNVLTSSGAMTAGKIMTSTAAGALTLNSNVGRNIFTANWTQNLSSLGTSFNQKLIAPLTKGLGDIIREPFRERRLVAVHYSGVPIGGEIKRIPDENSRNSDSFIGGMLKGISGSGIVKSIGNIVAAGSVAGKNLANYLSGNKTEYNAKQRVGSFGAGVGSRHEIYKTITPLNGTNKTISDLVPELIPENRLIKSK